VTDIKGDKMSFVEKENPLAGVHTKVLLSYLKGARKCGGFWSPSGDSNGFGFTTDELKKELATREHVPNKQEARHRRQERARVGF
jgi:hypothetical protein